MPNMTIYPAHMTTKRFEMQGKGGQTARIFHELALKVGDEEAYARMGHLHPFAQANYGQPVIVMGVSASTHTGRVETRSGGVVAGEALSNFLSNKGPMPQEVRQLLAPNKSATFMARTIGEMRPAKAAGVLIATGESLLRGAKGGLQTDALVNTYLGRLAEFKRHAASIPGPFQRLPSDGESIALAKKGSNGNVSITLSPTFGLAYRSEIDKGGVHFAIQPGGDPARVNVGSSTLILDVNSVRPQYIPSTKDGFLGVPKPDGFVF